MQPVTTSPKEPSLPIYLTLPTTLVTTLASVCSMRPLINSFAWSIILCLLSIKTLLYRLIRLGLTFWFFSAHMSLQMYEDAKHPYPFTELTGLQIVYSKCSLQ